MRSKYFLYLSTLKHLKPIQIYGRICSRINRPFTKLFLPSYKKCNAALKHKIEFIIPADQNQSEKIKHNEFTFLNKSHSFGECINWQENTLPLLWMFNLHYFNYLPELNQTERNRLINDWIENNPPGTQPGWHPYTISLRIVNWIKWIQMDEAIFENVFNQCSYLYRNLEYYHPANHLLENAKALIFAGIFFITNSDSRKWLNKGVLIYEKHLPQMVLDDGCFFESSPMYHSIMLEGILDILNILDSDSDSYLFFKSYAEKMLGHLGRITHPDGDIALFNDSTIEIAPKPKQLTDYASRLGFRTKESDIHSQLYSIRKNNLFFVIKSSEIGPDNIPAHSHADIFSYELSYRGKRFIVDSGNYDYENNEMRKYCRSTQAHNTVTIDGKDQAEMWNAFRVARRYKARDVSLKEFEGGFNFSGVFEGYSRLIGDNLVHKRTIDAKANCSQITFTDEINGNRNHLVDSYIHLHPDVVINKIGEFLILTRDQISIKLLILNYSFLIDSSWYCPEFGKKIENRVIKISSNQLPSTITYSFFLE